MANRDARAWVVVALTAAALGGSCTRAEERGPFRNQYIDAETGQPIEGVVFLVVWESVTPTITGDGGRAFYEAREAVSGPDGRVEIPALTGPIWRLALDLQVHEFIAGYVAERVETTPSGGQFYIDPTVTFMRRLRTREERCEVAHRSSAVPSYAGIAPLRKMERYMAALNREQENLKCGLLPRE